MHRIRIFEYCSRISSSSPRLFFWIYRPHQLLRKYYSRCLFDNRGADNEVRVTMCQWPGRPRTLVVHGSCKYEHEDSYVSVVAVPRLGCLDCRRLRDRLPCSPDNGEWAGSCVPLIFRFHRMHFSFGLHPNSAVTFGRSLHRLQPDRAHQVHARRIRSAVRTAHQSQLPGSFNPVQQRSHTHAERQPASGSAANATPPVGLPGCAIPSPKNQCRRRRSSGW